MWWGRLRDDAELGCLLDDQIELPAFRHALIERDRDGYASRQELFAGLVTQFEVIWNDIPDPHTPLGLHGIGEIGITGVGAAVANAVYNATGMRVRSLPITLDKLM